MKSKETLPKISFVTPNFNDGETLGQMIDSIFDQDWPNIEQIVVDDGSTDKSLEILEKKQKKYKNLKVIKGRHKGACFARNLGAAEATGDYISFLPADAVLYPGVVRNWMNKFIETDADFIYGGYRFVEELGGRSVYDYMSEAFDPYMLTVANYIDGSFPLKKSLYDKIGGWDTNIKSLQDWDFWLSAVLKRGAKGYYIPEVFFETTIPHKGGLSDDSQANWLERVNYIKKKQGISERKICVTSPGAPFHAKRIAKILEADYKENVSYKPHNYDLIYLLGFYSSVADVCAKAFAGCRGLRVIHWIGSDILQIQHLSAVHKKMLKDWLFHNIDLHLTEFRQTQKELEAEGIKSKILPLPPGKFYPITNLPKKFSVAIYMPQMNKNMYLPELTDRLTKNCRDVDFKFFGDQSHVEKKGNAEYLGRLDEKQMEQLINESSCLLRVLPHDGLSITVEEFLCAGRRVITNVPEIYGSFETISEEKSIIKTLNEVRKFKEPDYETAKYWLAKLSHKKFKDFFEELLKCDQKDYWETRANCWNEIEEKYHTQTLDKKSVLKQLHQLKPKSILDVGCGNGNWAKIIKEEFPNIDYLGVDISEKMVKIARRNCPDMKFQIGDIRNLKLNKKFDLIFSFTSILHIPSEDMERTIRSLSEISKKILMIEPVKEAERGNGYRQIPEEMIKEVEKGISLLHPKSDTVHNYDKFFKIKKRVNLGPRDLMIADL